MQKKTYIVGCYEKVNAYIYIDAESKEDAIKKAIIHLDEQGMPKDALVFNREFDALSAIIKKEK